MNCIGLNRMRFSEHARAFYCSDRCGETAHYFLWYPCTVWLNVSLFGLVEMVICYEPKKWGSKCSDS